MRLITDEQHAQIVEALERLKKLQVWKPFVTEDETDTWVPAEHQALEALATLQALPEVERKGWLHCGGGVTNSNPRSNFASSYKPLYATKEPS